jgi:D-xylose transport system substrate-binding protein
MKRMNNLPKRKTVLATAAAGVAIATSLAGCSSSSSPSTASGSGKSSVQVGIILPDEVTSPRWANADQPALQAECTKDKLSCDIQNAEDSDANELSIGNEMINNEHVQVLVVAGVDPAPTETITEEAEKQGITVIDYDRAYGSGTYDPNYYVSFNGVTVGVDQGNALVAAVKAKGFAKPDVAVIDGSQTDGNAVEFKQGYMSVLQPLFTAGTYKEAGDTWTPNWTNSLAPQEFAAMYAKDRNINTIMVANDGMADAIIAYMKSNGIDPTKFVISGQDSSALGLQDIMQGDQSFTIYKASTAEAVPTIDLAQEVIAGKKPTTVDSYAIKSQSYSTTAGAVPSILQTPQVITASNVNVPVAANYTPYSSVCDTAALVTLCTHDGITAPTS